MSLNCTPLSQFNERSASLCLRCSTDARFRRLFFTTFNQPVAKAEVLNKKHANANLTIKAPSQSRGLASPPESPHERPFYYFTFDDTLVYNSFYMDWGPLNLAMVYKACIFIHELLQVCATFSQKMYIANSNRMMS